MSGSLQVHLIPDRIRLQAGGEAAELVFSIQNPGNVVDQYSLELSGLDSAWYTPPGEISLFPEDREQVRISVHPNGSTVRTGD